MCSPWKLAFDNVMESYQKTQQKFSLSILSCEMEYNFQCNTYMKENSPERICLSHVRVYRNDCLQNIGILQLESFNHVAFYFPLMLCYTYLVLKNPLLFLLTSLSIGFLHSDRISVSPSFQFLAHSLNFSYQLSPLV